MTIATISALEVLLQLYSSGYQSPVVDQTIRKLVRLETARISAEMQKLKERLSQYELKYQMQSAQFAQQFATGELDDSPDFVEWSIFWDMWVAEQKRWKELEGVVDDSSQLSYPH